MESAKRLAERNRLAREAKKKAEAEAATAKAASPAPDTAAAASPAPDSGSSGLSLVALLGIGGLIVSAAGVYYQREAIMARLKPAPPPPAQPAEPAPSRIPVKRSLRKMED